MSSIKRLKVYVSNLYYFLKRDWITLRCEYPKIRIQMNFDILEFKS